MLSWTTAGESHGPALIALMEGMPAGVPVTTGMIQEALAERRLGYGRGARQAFERDEVRVISGLRHGRTTGAPITIEIGNSEWPKWQAVMSADPVDEAELRVDAGKGDSREMSRNKKLTTPRPGHADLAGMVSYRTDDARNILERASARETAARVALGALARSLLREVAGTEIIGHVVEVGTVKGRAAFPGATDRDALQASPMRTLDPSLDEAFRAVVDSAKEGGDTVGGVVEVVAWNVPLGLGSHVSSEMKLDAQIAAALMGIQSAKAVEIGDGFTAARSFGAAVQDEIVLRSGAVTRSSNRSGGIEGGTSNGEPVVARVGFKPISTVPRALSTVNLSTGEEESAFHQRSDTCQVVPAAVICESMVALVLARALTERFGGRSLGEVREQLEVHQRYVDSVLSQEAGR
ncbi:chorismate synthase [Actinomycetaceae bacterium MB13-C1-2]|nr:chorismate synthase [Actinomycetaceae bacterium MB13-C1-2]